LLTLAEALDACARGLGVALLQQSLEGLVLAKAYAEDGCFRLSDLKQAHNTGGEPGGWWLRCVIELGERGYIALHVLRIACGLGLLGFGHSLVVLPALFATALLFARQRDHFNGGSDAMTAVLLVSLSAACYPALGSAALAYVAAQVTLSYVVAGVAKLRNSEWQSGLALARFLQLERYAVPVLAERAFQSPLALPWLRGVTVTLPLLECAFPCVYLGGVVTQAILGLGLTFHLAVACLLGLNRFWPAWLAAYPAVSYFAGG
jgi:hypothetical protein